MNAHTPRKRFGQNFLESEAMVRRIVGAIAPRPTDRVVEIGPGLGALTRPLLAKLERLDVVELDRDLAGSLHDRLGQPPNLVIHQADALKFDFRSLGEPVRLIGNLPYNISTPLLFRLLDQADVISDMHFMLQREVVDRICAEPGGKTWGRLGVMIGARADSEALFGVPPEAFRPAPRVDSAVVRIVPRALSDDERELLPRLEVVVRAAFSQRRKTLRNTLRGLIDEPTLSGAGVDPSRRAETLSLAEFQRLAEHVPEDRTKIPE